MINGPSHETGDIPHAKAVKKNDMNGFSLQSVTWGYRDIFARTIAELSQHGWLGPERSAVTRKFFEILQKADQGCFDHVLRQFLGALTPQNRWIMNLPGIFTDLVDQGVALAGGRFHNGIRYFEILAEGGMGDSPRAVRACLNWLQRLRKIDDDLAMAFLSGYRRLSQRLNALELQRYMDVALQMHQNHPETAVKFLRNELPTSETYILAITQECRLIDVADALRMLIKALSGADLIITDLGQLDFDDLIERETQTLCAGGHLYLPERFREFDSSAANRNWYRLCGIVAAACLLNHSFACVHGHPRYRTCADLTGDNLRQTNLFLALEFIRVLRQAVRRWPGMRRLLQFGLTAVQPDSMSAAGTPLKLLTDALNDTIHNAPADALRNAADGCVNFFDAVGRLEDSWTGIVLAAYPQLNSQALALPGFFPDYMFPVSHSNPPADMIIADMHAAAQTARAADTDGGCAQSVEPGHHRRGSGDRRDGQAAPAPAYIYDEWDFQQNVYRPNWCHVHQHRAKPAPAGAPRQNYIQEAHKVRAIFERLKPDLAHREKYLADGDDINMEMLIEYKLDRLHQPAPVVRFYEKPMIQHRDLATMILLDISGSTGEMTGNSPLKVLDIEKQAALTLGAGLHLLGDRFAVCGFNSNGREHCEFHTFKNFDQAWNQAAESSLMSAWPQGATRIGPALRHAGYLLAAQPSRQRLIILITDGQPMDQDYSPETRYAQHDVRMACEENSRRDIHTFAVSTWENSMADMEIMFPGRKFVMLTDIRQLPRLLPRLYLRLTL